MKGATTSKKRPETTCNEQETTWNNLQRAKKDLKRPTTSKKQPETTWNKLEQERNDIKRPTLSKEQPETTCIEQILNTWSPLPEK